MIKVKCHTSVHVHHSDFWRKCKQTRINSHTTFWQKCDSYSCTLLTKVKFIHANCIHLHITDKCVSSFSQTYPFMHITDKCLFILTNISIHAHHWQMSLFILTNISIHAHHWQMHSFIHIILTHVSIRSHHSHKKSNGLHNNQTPKIHLYPSLASNTFCMGVFLILHEDQLFNRAP